MRNKYKEKIYSEVQQLFHGGWFRYWWSRLTAASDGYFIFISLFPISCTFGASPPLYLTCPLLPQPKINRTKPDRILAEDSEWVVDTVLKVLVAYMLYLHYFRLVNVVLSCLLIPIKIVFWPLFVFRSKNKEKKQPSPFAARAKKLNGVPA